MSTNRKVKRDIVICIPLACGYMIDHRDGNTTVDDSTALRIDACLEALSSVTLLQRPARILFPLTAGFSKDDPCTYKEGGPKLSLAEQMEIYTKQFGFNIQPQPVVHSEPLGWGTKDEITHSLLNSLLYLNKYQGKAEFNDVTVMLSTNWSHMFRVKLLIKNWPIPEDWKVVYVTAKHHFSLMSHLREIPAFLITWGRIQLKSWRRSVS